MFDDEVATYYNDENRQSVDQPNATIGTIVISNATAKWSLEQSKNSLKDIQFSIESGRLVAIIGTTGSGKVYIILQ